MTNVVALNRINRENSRCKHILTIHSHTQLYTCVLYFCYHVFERYTSQKKIINNQNFQVFKILSLTYQKTTQRNTLQMSIRVFFFFSIDLNIYYLYLLGRIKSQKKEFDIMNFMLTNYFQAINFNSCRQFILNFLRKNPFFATKMYVNNYRHFNR